MKLFKLCAMCAVFALTFSLTACGSDDPEQGDTHSASDKTSVTSSEDSSKDTAKDSAGNKSTDTKPDGPASSGATALKDPERTELSLQSQFPKTVGAYTAENAGSASLGQGASVQIEYNEPGKANDHQGLTVSGGVNEYASETKSLEGEVTSLGKLGQCGYQYGSKHAPTCIIRLEDGTALIVGGTWASTLDEVIDFTTEMLNLM